jgi:hypothetical protein
VTTPPILIVKQGTTSKSDIAMLRKCGIAVLPVRDIGDVRYMDPPMSVPADQFRQEAVRMVEELLNVKYGSLNTDEAGRRMLRVVAATMAVKKPDEIEKVQS